MGSKTFDGVRFEAWSLDHDPIHVHGYYAGVEVVVNLNVAQRRVEVTRRPKPRKAKRADIAHIVRTAERNFDMLVTVAEDVWRRRNL